MCTEVVWRSYRIDENKQGLNIPLSSVAGRRTLPANDIVKFFAEHRTASNPQLEFVYFIDASSDDTKAFVSDEEAFAESFKRVKVGLN